MEGGKELRPHTEVVGGREGGTNISSARYERVCQRVIAFYFSSLTLNAHAR